MPRTRHPVMCIKPNVTDGQTNDVTEVDVVTILINGEQRFQYYIPHIYKTFYTSHLFRRTLVSHPVLGELYYGHLILRQHPITNAADLPPLYVLTILLHLL